MTFPLLATLVASHCVSECVQSLCGAPAVHGHAHLHSWGMGVWTGAPLLVALGDTLAQGSPRQVGVLDSGQLGESLSLSLA